MPLFRNLSYENELDLREDEPVGGRHEWFRLKTCFHTEAQGNSEMAYWIACQPFSRNPSAFVFIRVSDLSVCTTYVSFIYLFIN